MRQYMNDNYDDIINLPHHISDTRPRMSLYDRAAQFSPFAAVTAHGEVIRETERLTEDKISLEESDAALINEQLLFISENLSGRPFVRVTYFVPDQRKSGGAYVRADGNAKRLDLCERLLILEDGAKIPLDDIIRIEAI
ncbi:MAG: hypothetical protein NC223_11105 [Butyrivibrio sp.]|nr:hypothetical protein [Butyrivibrio sp.]